MDLELAKNHEECKVQSLVEEIKLCFMFNNSTQNGLINISAIKFHGYGLYSDLEVPWNIEAVEYCWLMEFLIGNIDAKLSTNEVKNFFKMFKKLF